jgi:Protein of unknown function (DUF3000)
MVARREAADAPEDFRRAVAALRAASPRPEVLLEETPAPQRLAPHAVALTADVSSGDDELATGRFVLLHDPVGHEAWAGTFRVVTYVRADLEPEMAVDPLLAGVGWARLTESLDAHRALFGAPSGTVNRVASESFGALATEEATAQIEIRASWTPLDEAVDRHLLAWCDLLCTTAGLPPVAPGVVTLPRRRPGVR